MKQEIAVKCVAVVITLLLASCNFNLFEKGDNLLASCKLSDGKIIEVHSIGYGATTKDMTIIGIKEAPGGELDTLKKIESNFEIYKTDIVRINDTTFQVKFTDTIYHKGTPKYASFNIKNKNRLFKHRRD